MALRPPATAAAAADSADVGARRRRREGLRRGPPTAITFTAAVAFSLLLSPDLPAAFAGGVTSTPVAKVLDLLGRLRTKLEEESKTEAKAYDEFACFCKEQVDEKTYQIETSAKKVLKLGSKIDALESDISALNTDIQGLASSIADLDQDVEEETKARRAAHADYAAEDRDSVAAVNAVNSAIKALEESKEDAGEAGDVDLDLAQLRSSSKLAAAAVEAKLRQAPHAAKYSSNDIIATLKSLRDSFLAVKKQRDIDEFKARSAFEGRVLNVRNTREFQARDKSQKEQVLGEKTEQKEALTGDLNAETAAKQADQEFRSVLTGDCEEKAHLWDQRSKARAEELSALAQAMASLEEGVKPNYGANKKLVGLQVSRSVAPSAIGEVKPHAFVQLGRRGRKSADGVAAREASAIQEAVRLLSESGGQLHSSALSELAARLEVSEDHFVKVRQLIKDLMQRLQDDADAEATQKGFCDTQTAQSVASRDSAQGKIEELSAAEASRGAARDSLKSEIADVSKAIAEERKALLEAGQLRAEEQAENDATVRDAQEGKNAVTLALQVLQEYYGSADASFVQTASQKRRSRFTPPAADREGKTVGDRAPEVFDGEYHGAQDASKGIIGLLEVILSDFERTISSVAEEERQAAERFDALKVEGEASISDKEASVKTKEGEVVDLESMLADIEDSLGSQKRLLESAKKSLEALKSQCVDAEESYAERVAKREQEIESLKQAINILEDWQQ